jgi:hypothetical protein
MQGSRSSVVTNRLPPARAWAAAALIGTLASGAVLAGTVDSPDCEARLEAAVTAISTHPRVKDMPRDRLKATTEFALGNSLFAALHEVGHGLISDLGLPVLGREEDAADAFATVAILEMKTEFTHRILVNAAKGWIISDRRSRDAGEGTVYYDAHGLDLQRAYNIICLMVGSDPDLFDDLAREVNLPPERQSTCVGDYSNASWSWNKALKPFERPAGEVPPKYEVVYDKPEGQLDIFEAAFRASGVMEKVAEHAARYAWRKPFKIQVETCGEAGAQWNLPDHKMEFCYELTDDFVQLYKLHGTDTLAQLTPPPTASRRGTGTPMGFR